MRIIGIDPGFHRCGYAVLDCLDDGGLELQDSGVMVTVRGEELWRRLHAMAAHFEQLIALWQPAGVAVEEIYFAKNAKTAIDVAHARGVILERSAAAGLAVFEYTPTMIKSQLTGSGRADKDQVAFMVRRLIELPGDKSAKRLDDELDAIAVALCHAQRATIPEALR